MRYERRAHPPHRGRCADDREAPAPNPADRSTGHCASASRRGASRHDASNLTLLSGRFRGSATTLHCGLQPGREDFDHKADHKAVSTQTSSRGGMWLSERPVPASRGSVIDDASASDYSPRPARGAHDQNGDLA